MKIETTKERILEAASKCPQVRDTLKTIFPEVFESDKYFDLSKIETTNSGCVFSDIEAKLAGFEDRTFMRVRKGGENINKAFLLSMRYNWEILTDSTGTLCLLPTKK